MKALAILLLLIFPLLGAGYQTENFMVNAPTPAFAKEIGDLAEWYRAEAAKYWFGTEMPKWSKPCPIVARITNGSGGATSFIFDQGQVYGWNMKLQGSRERILDSVLPHEVTHTIFASHFRQPLPRWADEGACTFVESASEVARQERSLIQFLKTRRGIPFDAMLEIKTYNGDVLALYAQGHSVCQWLIEKHGKEKFMAFVANGLADRNWPRAVRDMYGHDTPRAMQNEWMDWVRQGRPVLITANYQQGGDCQNGDCYPQTYGPPSRPQPSRPQPTRPVPAVLTPIQPPPIANPPLTNDPAPSPQPPAPACDCGPKWAAYKEWQLKIQADFKHQLESRDHEIVNLKGKISQLAVAINNSQQNLQQTVDNRITQYFEDNPGVTVDDVIAALDHETPIRVYLPDGTLAGETKTNLFNKDGSIDFTFNPRALLDSAK